MYLGLCSYGLLHGMHSTGKLSNIVFAYKNEGFSGPSNSMVH